MTISRFIVMVGALLAGLSVLPSAEAQFGRSEELVCSGSVTYGQNEFPDQLILRVSNREVEVNGQAREVSTFEVYVLPYKICSESRDELEFEYTTSEKCGTNSTRAGHLNKVLGILRLSRSDRGQPFVGDYKCKPAQRVLN